MDEWPSKVLPASDINWRLSGASISTRSISNRARFVATQKGGAWLCDLNISLSTKRRIGGQYVNQINLVRALLDGFDGGATPIVLRTCECNFSPRPVGYTPSDGVPFSDGAPFSDGSLFESGVISITAGAAELGDVQISIDVAVAGQMIGGERFSVVYPTMGEHMHTVARVIDASTIVIRPPWHEDTPADTPMNFDNPGCQVHCLNADSALSAVNMGRWATLSIQFEEDFPEPAE